MTRPAWASTTAPRSRSQAYVFWLEAVASRNRAKVGDRLSPVFCSHSRCTNRKTASAMTTIHGSLALSAARPRAVMAVNSTSAPSRISAALLVSNSSAAATPSAYQERRRPCPTARQ